MYNGEYFHANIVTVAIQPTEVLPACTMGEQDLSFSVQNSWSGKKKKKMERLGYLQAISHTWSRIGPNEQPDLEWAEQTYLWW